MTNEKTTDSAASALSAGLAPRRGFDDERDIVEQLQDACDLATDKRELERLCGNAKAEIILMREMYNGQCACTDEWAEKYHAEVERKANSTLLWRITDLEAQLATVNSRLAEANARVLMGANAEITGG